MGLIVTFSYMHIMFFDHIAIALLSLLHLVSHPPPPLFYFDIFKKNLDSAYEKKDTIFF